MRLKKIKSLWGMSGPLDRQIARIAEAGYDGVEAALVFMEEREREQLAVLLQQYRMDLIAQALTSGGDVAAHIEHFNHQLELASSFGAILVDAHGGKDHFRGDARKRFFDAALSSEARIGVPVGHETHRGRPLFTPWDTGELLTEFPELKITADISHWYCVCESDLAEHGDAMRMAAERTIHIHARVGYAEGPQVPHPAAPEYEGDLERHEAFWETVCRLRQEDGTETLTVTPEFGPPSYLHTLPFTNQPVADLWEVNEWMKARFVQRFAGYFQD